jgi:hypothetical protein
MNFQSTRGKPYVNIDIFPMILHQGLQGENKVIKLIK